MKNIHMKNITLKILACAALISSGTFAAASGFGLDSTRRSDLGFAPGAFPAPVLEKSAVEDDLVSIVLGVKVPFGALRTAAEMIAVSERRLTIIDPAAPVVVRSGEFLKIVNLNVNINGITAIPTLTLKPYLEGTDRLAIRIERVQFHASMQPGKSVRQAADEFNTEDMVAEVMNVLIDGIMKALDARFASGQIPLKASEILTMSYDKAAWTLHSTVSTKFLERYLPQAIFGKQIHLTKFSFDDTSIGLKLQTK